MSEDAAVSYTPVANVESRKAHWLSAVACRLDIITSVALIVASTPLASLLSKAPLPVAQLNVLDDSWRIDIIYKALSGVWLDRNVIFTYGPLYQLITAIPARLLGFSLKTFYLTGVVTLIWTTIVLTFSTAKVLLHSEPAWKRALFLVLVVGFWSPLEVRTSALLFFYAVFVACVARILRPHPGLLVRAAACAFLLILAFMLSADTGFYAAIALILILAVSAIVDWKSARNLIRLAQFGLLSLAGFALFGIGINVAMGDQPFGFRFLRDAYQIVSTYRWIEPVSMPSNSSRVLMWTLAAAALIYCTALLKKDFRSTTSPRWRVFLLSSPLVALVVLQSALVRPGWEHMVIGLFPIILFSLVVLLGTRVSSITRTSVCLLIAVGGTGLITGPVSWLRPHNVIANYSFHSRRESSTCSGIYVDGVCFDSTTFGVRHDATALQVTSDFLRQTTAPTDSVMVFPYQNLVGDAARRLVAGGVLQNYLIGGEYLTRRQIVGLETLRPRYGVYFLDWPGVYKVDDVSSFTRTPQVWFYMQRHYSAERQIAPGIIALVRDESRPGRIRQQPHMLSGTGGDFAVAEDPQTIDLGKISWPNDADFLKLTMTMHYPVYWKLLKPAEVIVIVQLADGSEKQAKVVLRPNTSNEVWVYPWGDEGLGGFFNPAPAGPQAVLQPAVVGIKIRVARFDWISVMPTRVSVSRAEAVSLQY
jgi:hypothetical protein